MWEISSLIIIIGWTTLFLFLWFRTDTFFYYGNLFRWISPIDAQKFEEFKKQYPYLFWPDFLASKYEHKIMPWTIKLISCYLCLGAWLSLSLTYVINLFALGLNLLETSQIYFAFFFWPWLYISSLLLFRLIVKLL